MYNRVAVGLLAAAMAGCGGNGEPADPRSPGAAPASAAVPPTAITDTDLKIAERLYADDARTPPEFYREATFAGATYATIVHLRTTHLDPVSAGHELCAADFHTAFGWDEAVARLQPIYGDLVENSVSERAYEFVRRLRTTPARTVVQRVYRCDYIDRTGADPSGFGPAGRFGRTTFDAGTIRDLGEYLWTFTADNNANRAVLSSTAVESADAVTHAIEVARLERGLADSCDRVELWRVTIRARRYDARLSREQTMIRAFAVRRVHGLVQPCE